MPESAEQTPTHQGDGAQDSQATPTEAHDGTASSSTSRSASLRDPDAKPFVPPVNPNFPTPTESMGALSPTATDRVFPIRSVVSVDPSPTPNQRAQGHGDYFHSFHGGRTSAHNRRQSQGSAASISSQSQASQRRVPSRKASSTTPRAENPPPSSKPRSEPQEEDQARRSSSQLPAQLFSDSASTKSAESGLTGPRSHSPSLGPNSSMRSAVDSLDDIGSLVTHRFKHVVTDGGHAVITGRDGDTLQRCEDEPIHIPGAVQGFGLLIALQEDTSGNGSLPVRVVSENSRRIIGYSPRELFALESFTDILSEEQADNLLDHIDFIKDEDADVQTNGPDVFTISVKIPKSRSRKLWCALHTNDANPGVIICEFELEDDQLYPLVPPNDPTTDLPEDTLDSNPTDEEFLESTEVQSRPLRVLRGARKRRGEAAAMEVFNIMSQVQEQLAAAPTLEKFLKVLVGVVKELTGFHRVMIYQFDQQFNGRVVTELVDPRATKDLFKGLNFPASDIPKQARDLYKINKVRMLYDRDQETARLVCRTPEDLETPLDLTHSYLRAMSPIHIKYLGNMAVRSSMSISINAFNELWGLIACHSYGPRGMRVSFPIRKMCRLVGDSASRNIERLSYASRLQARKLINTVPTQQNPSGYIIASSDDLLKLFDADFGLLSIHDETKILGQLESSQESLALLEYLRMRKITSVMTSQDVSFDFPDLRYQPGFRVIAGMLVVPLSSGGQDFIVFFRKGQLREVKWAGNPYEKFIQEGTSGYLEPRKSFKTWCETVVGKSREWSEEEIETAAVLCLVYGKFIEVWRQKEAAVQSSQLTRLLLANSAHEVRTPLNAIINYLEIALEGSLDSETRENLSRSHSASKSLIYVINDLLDLTKTEEGAALVKGESFELSATLKEATDMFNNDAKRKNITYEVIEHPGLPRHCMGDQRRVRQVISNITANAIQNTTQGGVKVEMYVASRSSQDQVEVEVAITDSGVGMSSKKLDQLFNDLEQVQSEPATSVEDALLPDPSQLAKANDKTALGLGLAVVARIVRNMNGQLRLKSEEGVGSRFVVQFPFELPDSESDRTPQIDSADKSIAAQSGTPSTEPTEGERTLVAPNMSRHNSDSANTTTGNTPMGDSSTGNPSMGNTSLTRKTSVDSLNSKHSLNSKQSLRSFRSSTSQRSDVDRLIDAIQEPHMIEPRPSSERSTSPRSLRPTLTKRHTMEPPSPRRPSTGLEQSSASIPGPPHTRSLEVQSPGEEGISFSGRPLRALKVPDELGSPVDPRPKSGEILGEITTEPEDNSELSQGMRQKSLSAEHMRVLVAEDDPVNSRIIKKRLEKLGHSVHLTVNGEECAGAFGDHPKDFDAVLMDMQMPIVDGLTATKMIRSFEKTHSNIYSPRAALNGRIPIIAVSASLLEKKRSDYINAGFDAWILKPIAFQRLNHLMAAIVDRDIRRDSLYQPGGWEQGGWFAMEHKSPQDVDTKPSSEPTQSKAADELATEDEASGTVSDKDTLPPPQSHDKGKRVHYENESPNEPAAETLEESSSAAPPTEQDLDPTANIT